MAGVQIKCPECRNQRGVPDDLVGKKSKCKKCQSVFTVKAPAAVKPAKPAAPAKPASPGQTAAPPNVFAIKKEEEKDDRTPYIMREENLAARCPFCAMLMDPPDAKICLHCGYDMQKRKRVERKVVYQTGAADYILWHLSTVACFIVIGAVVTACVLLFIMIPDWLGDFDLVPPGCFQTWVIIFTLFICWLAGRFIFRKLVWKFHPPEREKKKSDEDDEEYEYEDDYDDDDDDD